MMIKMVVACILVCCEAGKYKDVLAELKKIGGVRRAFAVHGRWDIVAEIEVADPKELGEAVLKLHEMAGVRATETLVSL